jgi:hypothetical protein
MCGILHVHTSCALDLEHALLASVALESADKRGGHGEDSPLSVCGRGCLGTRGRRGVDDVLVAAGDVGAVAGGVERGHGEGWWGTGGVPGGRRRVGGREEGGSGKNWRRECPLYAQRLTGYGCAFVGGTREVSSTASGSDACPTNFVIRQAN